MANPTFTFSALPMGSGDEESQIPSQRKRIRHGDELSADLQIVQMDAGETPSPNSRTVTSGLSYASTLMGPANQSHHAATKDLVLEAEDCQFSQGKRGPKISFSQKVHDKLNFNWKSAVIVKLMGKPYSTNAFQFHVGWP